MAVVNKFNVNKQEVTLDADIIENMSANDVSYNNSFQYDENTVGDKLSELEKTIDEKINELMCDIHPNWVKGNFNTDTGDEIANEKIARCKYYNLKKRIVKITVNNGFMFAVGHFSGSTWINDTYGLSVTEKEIEFVENVEYKIKLTKTTPESIDDLNSFVENINLSTKSDYSIDIDTKIEGLKSDNKYEIDCLKAFKKDGIPMIINDWKIASFDNTTGEEKSANNAIIGHFLLNEDCAVSFYFNASYMIAFGHFTNGTFIYDSNSLIYGNGYHIQLLEKGEYIIKVLKITPEIITDVYSYAKNVIVSKNIVTDDISAFIVYNKDENGGFYTNTGNFVKTTTGAFAYSNIFAILKGDTIKITANAKSTNISILSKIDKDGNFVSCLYQCTADIMETFEYTASDDIEYLVISFCSRYDDPTVILTRANNYSLYKNFSSLNDRLSQCERYIEDKKSNSYNIELSMFPTMAICGDSYAVGGSFNNEGVHIGDIEKISWGKVLERVCGIDVSIFGEGGLNTHTFLVGQRGHSPAITDIVNSTPKDLYVICLGINDWKNQESSESGVTLGSIADIKTDYTQNPNTVYGNMGSIIQQIKNHAPKARIVLSKTFIPTRSGGIYYNYTSAAYEEIAAKFDIPIIETKNSEYMCSDEYNTGMLGGHPTAIQYSQLAHEIKILLEKSINSNKSYYNAFIW